MVLPRQKAFSCFDCKFYRPDETREFQGNCCRPSPQSESAQGAGEPGMEWCFIQVPSECWCGDFEKWLGTPRPVGVCPYVPPTQQVLAKSLESNVETTAKSVAAAAPAAPAPKPATKTRTTKKVAPKKVAAKRK